MYFFRALALAVALLPAAAQAAQKSDNPPPPSTIDFAQPLRGPDGKPLQSGDCAKLAADGKTCAEYKPMTLGDAACVALEATFDDERNQDGAAKFTRDEICRRIYRQKSIELSLDDLATIKKRIGRAFSAAVVGAAWPVLDPAVARGAR